MNLDYNLYEYVILIDILYKFIRWIDMYVFVIKLDMLYEFKV